MLKYLTHKLRTQSINASSSLESHSSGGVKKDEIDGHDSGTESDGDIDVDDPEQIEEHEMDLSMNSSSRQDTSTSPSDSVTLCSSESPIFLGPPLGMYDQAHSSEEELEVINGPSPSKVLSDLYQNGNSGEVTNSCSVPPIASVEISPKRCCSSTLLEKRKRSLAHNSDDEVRHLLEKQQNLNNHHHHHLLAPVNFRTSPPLEALKPYRGHILRPTTPLVLAERGIENIRISTPNSQQQQPTTTSSNNSSSKQCDSPTQASSDSVIVQQQQQQLIKDRHECSSRSISPPAKMFHCAVSPTRSLNGVSSSSSSQTRASRHHHSRNQNQRLQRPYRPCLDFDKMQQLKARSIASWRHSNEHSGSEFSVFCW